MRLYSDPIDPPPGACPSSAVAQNLGLLAWKGWTPATPYNSRPSTIRLDLWWSNVLAVRDSFYQASHWAGTTPVPPWPVCLACLRGRSAWPVCLACLPGVSVWPVCLAPLPGPSAWPVCLACLPGLSVISLYPSTVYMHYTQAFFNCSITMYFLCTACAESPKWPSQVFDDGGEDFLSVFSYTMLT